MTTFTRKSTGGITWEKIQAVVDSGDHKEVFPVDTEIDFQLKNAQPVTLVVRAQDHYQDGEIVLGFKDDYFGEHTMNKRNTNSGGWPTCDLRTYMNLDIWELIPDDLKEVVSPKTSKLMIDGEIVVCQDLLWLPTGYEVHGADSYSERNGEWDKQYEGYKDRRNRIAFDMNGYLDWWWNMTAVASSPYFAACIDNGYSYIGSASNSHGVRPHLLIRKRS